MSNTIFASVFKQGLVKEADELSTKPIGDISDQEAMQSTLDPGTETSEMGADSVMDPEDEKLLKYAATREMEMIKSLTGWVTELDNMVEYLNGTNPQSIQMILKKAVPDTIFDKMRSSEAKKIARVAKEISALAETFKGYLATADDSKYRFV